MKVKGVNLEYYVFYFEHRSKEPKRMNILKGLEEVIAKHIRSGKTAFHHIEDRETLREFLKSEFMYRYWSKCECEYVVGELWIKDTEELLKKDIWFQIEKNLDMITDYIIYKMKLDY